MSVIDIKSRQITVKSLLEEEMNNIESIEGLVIIRLQKDGDISMSHAEISHSNIIGYMECMKAFIIEEMRV